MRKIPIDIIRYEEKVFDTLEWAVKNGHISEEEKITLIDVIKDIKYDMYPNEYNPWE